MATVLRVDGSRTPDEGGLASTPTDLTEAAHKIVDRLQGEAERRVRARSPIEARWIDDLRQYHGRYPEATERDLVEEKKSTAFIKLTRQKTNGWGARISDLLLPTGEDRNWDIESTPIPKLAQAAQDALGQARAMVEQANQARDPAQAEMLGEQAGIAANAAAQTEGEIEEAKRRAKLMRDQIDDQLVESDYATQVRDVVEDGCKIGTGVLKGPITSQRIRRQWVQGDIGYVLRSLADPIPAARRVDPWHFFPDDSAIRIEESESEFERALLTKAELRKACARYGFDRAQTAKVLEEGPKLGASDIDYLTQLRAITAEGDNITNRFIVWEYHGPLDRDEIVALLHAAGKADLAERVEVEADEMIERRVIVRFCQGRLLKISPFYPLESSETLYSVWNFEKGETSIFGYGVPYLMRDSQSGFNAAWRMLMDNGALSVGPQIAMKKEGIEPADGSWGIRPMKVWWLTSTAMSSAVPPFQVFNVPNNQAQLIGILEAAKQFADDETSMPMMAQGEAGAQPQPVGTTSMLFNSANVTFRRVIRSFDDDLTKPTMRRFYDWNMQFNPNEDIKGDMQVRALGSSVLLVREIQTMNLMHIMQNWTVHPVLGAWIKVKEGLDKTVQTMMLAPGDIIKTAEVVQRELEEQAASQGEQQDPRIMAAQIDAQTRMELAKIEQQTAFAKLALQENLTLADIENRIRELAIKTQSEERKLATEVAVEEKRAERARSEQQKSSEATGEGIG